jgi:hypothetical protein
MRLNTGIKKYLKIDHLGLFVMALPKQHKRPEFRRKNVFVDKYLRLLTVPLLYCTKMIGVSFVPQA